MQNAKCRIADKTINYVILNEIKNIINVKANKKQRPRHSKNQIIPRSGLRMSA